MTSGFQRTTDPTAAIIARLAEIERSVRESVSGPMKIPVVGEDPPETDPTNIWMFPDGRVRWRHLNTAGSAWVYREFVATSPGSSTSATAPAAPVDVASVNTAVYEATWSQSYQEDGDARTDDGTVMLYYGKKRGDSDNGNSRSLIGFNYTTIAAQLTGSTINNVSLRLYNLDSHYDDGVHIYFGIHDFTSEPATWAGGGIPRQMIVDHHFPKVGQLDVPMPLEFAQAIRDGWGKGVAVEAPNSTREFYGKAAGVGAGLTLPTLIINYTK